MVTGTLEETGVPAVPLDYPASRDVLDPEDVRRTGARDLNDLIQYLPAVSTRPYNGGDASAPSFSMRGLPDDGLTEYILVLIDGVPANPLPYGWTAFSFFPLLPEQVYAIDLLRGGHSVRYSPNTVGGVINLLTGRAGEIGPHLASHADVNALDLTGAGALAVEFEEAAAATLTRVLRPGPEADGGEDAWLGADPGTSRMTPFLETKTVWHPVGV